MLKHAHKKGQGMEFSIALFIMMVAMIIILAPFLLRAVRDITSGLGNNLATLSPVGNISMQHVSTATTNLWDFGMILGFIILTIVLFISAFMADIHPLFIIVYVILAFILFMIVPALNDTFIQIYATPEMYNETSHLPMTDYLGQHFGIIAFIIYIISGAIMFGKMRMRQQSYG